MAILVFVVCCFSDKCFAQNYILGSAPVVASSVQYVETYSTTWVHVPVVVKRIEPVLAPVVVPVQITVQPQLWVWPNYYWAQPVYPYQRHRIRSFGY